MCRMPGLQRLLCSDLKNSDERSDANSLVQVGSARWLEKTRRVLPQRVAATSAACLVHATVELAAGTLLAQDSS